MGKGWDIRTWIIVILSAIVLLLALFGSGGGSVELKKLLDERVQQNKELQKQIDARLSTINDLQDSAHYYMEQDKKKAALIVELEASMDQQKKDIEALRGRMRTAVKPIEDATDEKRLDFWREYFERKGIKQ